MVSPPQETVHPEQSHEELIQQAEKNKHAEREEKVQKEETISAQNEKTGVELKYGQLKVEYNNLLTDFETKMKEARVEISNLKKKLKEAQLVEEDRMKQRKEFKDSIISLANIIEEPIETLDNKNLIEHLVQLTEFVRTMNIDKEKRIEQLQEEIERQITHESEQNDYLINKLGEVDEVKNSLEKELLQ